MAVGATLDAGALIAFERGQRAAVALVARARERGEILAIPAGVIGQVWRDGSRQARLATLLASDVVEIVALDEFAAKSAGLLCGARGTADVIDASVFMCAKARGHSVVTSDPDDMRRLDLTVKIVQI